VGQYDVREYDGGGRLVLDIQSDALRDTNSRVVIPLLILTDGTGEAVLPIKPALRIAGADYLLMTTDIGTVPLATLGTTIDNIEEAYRDTIIRALNFLISGF
jgi:toxin CcdB